MVTKIAHTVWTMKNTRFMAVFYQDSLVRRHQKGYKNSSGDEIANVNFYAVRPGSYPNSLK